MKKLVKNNLVIELHVPDLSAAKEFYSKLGFVVSLDDRPNTNELGYMTMVRQDKLGATMLNFYGGDERVYNQSFFKQFPRGTRRGYAVSITIPTADIEGLYTLAKEHLSGSIVRGIKEIQDHEHKWKDFRMADPFGFYLRFTELIDWGQE